MACSDCIRTEYKDGSLYESTFRRYYGHSGKLMLVSSEYQLLVFVEYPAQVVDRTSSGMQPYEVCLMSRWTYSTLPLPQYGFESALTKPNCWPRFPGLECASRWKAGGTMAWAQMCFVWFLLQGSQACHIATGPTSVPGCCKRIVEAEDTLIDEGTKLIHKAVGFGKRALDVGRVGRASRNKIREVGRAQAFLP